MLLISMVYAYKNQAKIQKKIVSLCLLDIQKRFWKTTRPNQGCLQLACERKPPVRIPGDLGACVETTSPFFWCLFLFKVFSFFRGRLADSHFSMPVVYKTASFWCRFCGKILPFLSASQQAGTISQNLLPIHPGRSTWNLRIHPWKRKNIWTKPLCSASMLISGGVVVFSSGVWATS